MRVFLFVLSVVAFLAGLVRAPSSYDPINRP